MGTEINELNDNASYRWAWTLDILIPLNPCAGATSFNCLMIYGSGAFIRLAPKFTDLFGEPLPLLDNALRDEVNRIPQKRIAS